MRYSHFETFAPVCPVCRTDTDGHGLQVGHVAREATGDLVEGTLACTNAACRCEFPVLDGLPIILPNVREFVAANAFTLLARRDLGEVVESLLGDCCGPGSAFDTTRQHVGSYAADHYAGWSDDPTEPTTSPSPDPAGVLALSRTLWQSAGVVPNGPVVDLGCALGRTTFDLADQRGEPVLGLDLNVGMLRVASELLRTGRTTFPRRRVGLVYDRIAVERRCERPELVDFWIADATALPLPVGRCAAATCLNLLDCVSDPLRMLAELERVLAPGGTAVVACPYDWSPAATALEGWVGGHSQRSPAGGSSESLVHDLLTPNALPQSLVRIEIVAEFDRLPWHVRLHDRSRVQYEVHGFVVRKAP
jgi:SAM-dependent methyltransferase/uncharacterized protein YbaR (Trm112 family)